MVEGACDVAVVGGGMAGLWARAALAGAGYSCVLVESGALGAGQTIASQGILHAGLKYAVSGEVREGSRLLAACGPRWAEALAGRGPVGLGGVRMVAERLVMWATPDVGSRVFGAFGSAFLRSTTRRLDGDERPVPFDRAPASVRVWEVDEPAVDARSLVGALAAVEAGPMVRGRVAAMARGAGGGGGVELELECGDGQRVRVRAGAVVLCAGAGNEALLRLAGVESGLWCQRRPLHMALVRGGSVGQGLAMVQGHCVQASDKPRLTVTSGEQDGRAVWYLGGEVAERGVERDANAQRAAALAEVRACLPWVDVGGVEVATLRVDRAEGRAPGGARPEGPVVRAVDGWGGRVVAVWPTKLALAPVVGDRVMEAVVAGWGAGGGGHGVVDTAWAGAFERPAVAGSIWDRPGLEWR